MLSFSRFRVGITFFLKKSVRSLAVPEKVRTFALAFGDDPGRD